MKYIIFILIIFSFVTRGLAQQLFFSSEDPGERRNDSVVFWRLTSLSGEIKARGLYREQRLYRGDFYDFQETRLLQGGIALKTSSYFFHPNFLKLDVDGEYNPEKHLENYLVVPDQSEVNNLKKLDIRTTFFQQRKLTLIGFANLSENYSNREYLTNLKTNYQNYGGMLSYTNKIVPVTINYHNGKWNQKEIETGRIFQYKQEGAEARLSKSFGLSDRHELVYSHDKYYRDEANYFNSKNISDNLSLNNSVYFDRKRNYSFSSMISAFDQQGLDEFTRLTAYERFNFRFIKNLRLLSNYSYNNIMRKQFDMNQHNVDAMLEHKLFNNFTSHLTFDFIQTNHTLYKDTRTREGFDFLYTRKISVADIMLSYKYIRQHQVRNSDPSSLQVLNEEYVLTDGSMILLNKPYVDINSVVVTDVTGTVIYQLNFDYVLIQRNNYLEIQRMPGGLIANGATVYVDYISIQPGDYKYNANIHYLNASLFLFKKFIEFYYRFSKQDYVNIEQTDFITLNYYTQNVIGTKLDYHFVSAGAEYDYYNSSIIPYKMMRYFIQVQGNVNKKMMCSLIGNYRDYKMINDDINQRYADISALISYMVTSRSKIELQGGYRNQRGREIDLDLITSRLEFTTSYRKLFLSVGLEFYKRNYINEKIDFRGGYVQIARRF